MIVSIILLSLGVVFASLFIYGKVTHYSYLTMTFKVIASLLFVSLAVYLFIYKEYPLIGVFIIIGALFGLLGDLFLAFKRIFIKKDKLMTLFGILFFMVGHAVYVSGLYVSYYDEGHALAIIIPIIISLLLGLSVLLFERLMKLHLGKFRIGIIAYIAFLTSLSISSFALLIVEQFQSVFLIMMTVGGLLFLASDITLGKTYFGENVKKIDLVLSSVTYYLAQFIIVFALFFL